MKYFARLVKGVDYYVHGINFKKDEAVEIDISLSNYLADNPQFEVTEEDVKAPEPPKVPEEEAPKKTKAAPKPKAVKLEELEGE